MGEEGGVSWTLSNLPLDWPMTNNSTFMFEERSTTDDTEAVPALLSSARSLFPISISCCRSLASWAMCLAASFSLLFSSCTGELSFVAEVSAVRFCTAPFRKFRISSCNCCISNSYNMKIYRIIHFFICSYLVFCGTLVLLKHTYLYWKGYWNLIKILNMTFLMS